MEWILNKVEQLEYTEAHIFVLGNNPLFVSFFSMVTTQIAAWPSTPCKDRIDISENLVVISTRSSN